MNAVFPIMDIDKIQEKFAKMGLGTPERRAELTKELSIDMVDFPHETNKDLKIYNNTLEID